MLRRPYDALTFDCYGTLVDWEGGIVAAFDAVAERLGRPVERATVLALHAELEPQVQTERFQSYHDVLAETARRMAARLGWALPPAEAEFLPRSLPEWAPFADTQPALERLGRAGYRLGILSNVDDALLAATVRRLGVAFDTIVTAEQVRSYKPAQGHFLEARRRLAGARWLHAAQSVFHDVAPARALGIPAAWINRHAEPRGVVEADYEVADLRGLADLLAP